MLKDWTEMTDSPDAEVLEHLPRRRKSGRPSAEIELLTAHQIARFQKRDRSSEWEQDDDEEEFSRRDRRKSPRYDRSKRL